MMRRRAAVTLAIWLWLVAGPVSAQQAGVHVESPWSRAALQGHTGAIYLTVTNTGPADQLTGIASPVAERAEVHESFQDHGVMKMRPVASLPVAPGQPIRLTPGGYHIMLMDLKKPLNPGDHVPVTLTFEKAGPVQVEAIVAKAGASGPPDHAGTHTGTPTPAAK
jgi:copper(I)-binding protein